MDIKPVPTGWSSATRSETKASTRNKVDSAGGSLSGSGGSGSDPEDTPEGELSSVVLVPNEVGTAVDMVE